jgi:hypothetical protein
MTEATTAATPAASTPASPTKGGSVTFGATNLQAAPASSAPSTETTPNTPETTEPGEPKTKYKVYGKELELTEKQARDAVEKYYASEKKFEELKAETTKAKEAQQQLQKLGTEVRAMWQHAATSGDAFGEVIERIGKLSGHGDKLINSAIQWVVDMANENALPEDQRKFRQEQRQVQREKAQLDAWKKQQAEQHAAAEENALFQQIDQHMPGSLQGAGLPDKPATRYRVLELTKFFVQKGQANAMSLAVQRVRQEYEKAGLLSGTQQQRPDSAPKRRATPQSVGSQSRQKAPTYKSFEEFERVRKGKR